MNHQLLCAWGGLAFLVLFLLGWVVVGGFFPPPSPLASAEQIAAFYSDRTALTRAGLLIAVASCTFYVPWSAVISQQLRRIRGVSPVLVQTQALSGVAGMLIFLLPLMIWITASFRPERDPQLTLLLNDFGWLLFTMTFVPFLAQDAAIGLAILGDRSAQPVFPRWAAYFNFWVALSFVPAALIVYFKRGPLAWTGVIGLWLPLVLFASWIIVMFVLLRRAILREAGNPMASANGA